MGGELWRGAILQTGTSSLWPVRSTRSPPWTRTPQSPPVWPLRLLPRPPAAPDTETAEPELEIDAAMPLPQLPAHEEQAAPEVEIIDTAMPLPQMPVHEEAAVEGKEGAMAAGAAAPRMLQGAGDIAAPSAPDTPNVPLGCSAQSGHGGDWAAYYKTSRDPTQPILEVYELVCSGFGKPTVLIWTKPSLGGKEEGQGWSSETHAEQRFRMFRIGGFSAVHPTPPKGYPQPPFPPELPAAYSLDRPPHCVIAADPTGFETLPCVGGWRRILFRPAKHLRLHWPREPSKDRYSGFTF